MDEVKHRPIVHPYIAAMIAAAVTIGASLLLKHSSVHGALRTLVALSPLPFFSYLVISMVRSGRDLDEFQMRVQLETILGAFLSSSIILLLGGFLQWAGTLGPINLAFAWPMMAAAYTVSYAIASRRYR